MRLSRLEGTDRRDGLRFKTHADYAKYMADKCIELDQELPDPEMVNDIMLLMMDNPARDCVLADTAKQLSFDDALIDAETRAADEGYFNCMAADGDGGEDCVSRHASKGEQGAIAAAVKAAESTSKPARSARPRTCSTQKAPCPSTKRWRRSSRTSIHTTPTSRLLR